MDTAEKMIADTLQVMTSGPTGPVGSSMTPDAIVDYLTYCNYRHNRQTMTAEELAPHFPGVAATLEERYRDEINAYVNRAIKREQETRGGGRADGDMDTFCRKLEAGS